MYTILQCSQHKYADRHFRKLILLDMEWTVDTDFKFKAT